MPKAQAVERMRVRISCPPKWEVTRTLPDSVAAGGDCRQSNLKGGK